jgi:hypothetical protein
MDTGLTPNEGESFVDEARQPIPPANTWDELTVNQLIELKGQLEEKRWAFAKNAVIAKALDEGLAKITLLISSRSS